MKRLLSILLLVATLWIPAQAQQKTNSPCKISPPSSLPYTTGELQDIFRTYNREYWDGKLPATVVVWTALPGKKIAETDVLPDGRFIIRLDSTRNSVEVIAKQSILHEMAHIKTWGDQCHVDGKPNQCDRWLAEIHRIMLEGALDDII